MVPTSLPPAASAARLTAALRRVGVLGAGEVVGAEVVASWPKARNRTVRLRLSYAGAPPGSPPTLILKLGHRADGDGSSRTGSREPTFYREVAPLLKPGLVPRCFESTDATPSEPGSLLLEDLTDTHAFASEHPLPPPIAMCHRILCRWADLHAGLWNDPRLEAACGTSAAAFWSRFLSRSAQVYPSFIDRFGDLLPGERRSVCKRIVEGAPRFLARLGGVVPLTLVHGDAHWWNCLVPREGMAGEIRLIDWEDLMTGPATMDLAYMMAMLWFPDRRRAWERSMLDSYHEALARAGVTSFSRGALAEDYRWSVALQTLRPIWQAMAGLPARVWWPNLERNFLAFEDLGCEELLA